MTDWIAADEQGWVDITLSRGFVGYLEFSGDNWMPSLLFLGEQLTDSTALNYPLLAVSIDSLATLTGLLGITLEPLRGLLAVRTFDCDGITAPDVVLSTGGDGERWYFADGLPTVAATKTGSEGYGGFANVPPEVVSVDVQAPTGDTVSGTRTLVVRPGWFSLLHVWPPGAQISPPGAPSRAP